MIWPIWSHMLCDDAVSCWATRSDVAPTYHITSYIVMPCHIMWDSVLSQHYGHHDMILLVVPHCDIDFHLNLMDGHNASTGQGMNFIMYMIMAMVMAMIMVIFITMPIMWPIWYDMLCDDAVWYSAMRWDGTPCHITIVSFHDHSLSCHTISFHSVSLRVTSHRITTGCATSHHSTPYHVTSHQVTHDPNVMRDAMLVQHNMVLHVVMS